MNTGKYGIAVDASEYNIVGDIKILNNTIYSAGDNGSHYDNIYVYVAAGLYVNKLKIRNNVTSSAADQEINIRGTINAQNNGFNNFFGSSGSGYISGLGDINSDPNFKSVSTLDLTLNVGSPSIDTAAVDSDVTDDIDGRLKNQDGQLWDMGAYESTNGLYAPVSFSRVIHK